MNRWIEGIVRWWRSEHPPCARIGAWNRAWEDERRALASGCTQAVHKARKGKRAALHADLAGRA